MFITQFNQLASELFIRAFANDERRECLLQPLHDILQRHELFILWCVVRRQVGELNHTPIVEHLLELGILLDNPAVLNLQYDIRDSYIGAPMSGLLRVEGRAAAAEAHLA